MQVLLYPKHEFSKVRWLTLNVSNYVEIVRIDHLKTCITIYTVILMIYFKTEFIW